MTKSGSVLFITAGATFLSFLDTTVVNVAFPALAGSFPAASVSTLSWVVSAYAVLLAALLTPAGRLADVLGRKRLFLTSTAVFTAASLAAAVAPDVVSLIVARAVQGGAAAGMIPAALGLVLSATPPARWAAAIGVWGAAGSMASALGPALGGVLVEAATWRTAFLINVPFGVFLVVAGMRLLPADQPTGQRRPDLIGTLAITVGIGALVAGLTEGSTWGWTSGATLASLAGGVVLVAAGLLRSRRHPAPAVETVLWRHPTFAAASLVSLLAGLAMFAWMFNGPLFVARMWDYSVLKAGLAMTPGALASAVAAAVVGRRLAPRAQRIAVVVGLLIFAASALWFHAVATAEPAFVRLWLPAGILGGGAVGAVLTGLSSAAASSVPPQRLATGIGLTTTARQLGGALGVAAVAAILSGYAGSELSAFRSVFLFVGVAAVAAALAGLTLTRQPTGQPAVQSADTGRQASPGPKLSESVPQ